MSDKLLIYHANCRDGFGAAYAAWRKWENTAEYVPLHYKQTPPDVKGKQVVVADFSFPRDVMIRMNEEAGSFLVLDHHKTAKENCEGLDFCRFDMDKSGARLAWEHFHGDEPFPTLLQYIEDRDLWRFALPDSREINLAISSYPMDFNGWDSLSWDMDIGTRFGEILNEGEAIARYIDNRIELAKKSVRVVEVLVRDDVYEVPFLNCAYEGISELLNSICQDRKKEGKPAIAMGWFHRGDGMFQYSLRSIGDIDVSEIASVFGGGGHKNAAGFESTELLW